MIAHRLASRFVAVAISLMVGHFNLAMAGDSAGENRAAMDRALERVFPALVRITVVMEEGEEGRMQKNVGAGSGAIISEQGHVITNHHVAGKARHMVCRLADGEEIEARLVATDPLADIAVIQLDLARRKHNTKLPVAAFGDSDRLKIGDPVLAMGSPMAVTQSVTRGIVSNTQLLMPDMFWFAQLQLDGENVGSLVRWIGHDAVIYGGNSGGPLVNLDGEIVGINEVSLGSLGGAIPSNLARSVAQQLIAKGSVDRSWIGLEGQPMLHGWDGPDGVLVGGVIDGSPAATAGLRAGDVITEFAGTRVGARLQEDMPAFNALVLSVPIGNEVTLKVLRDGKPFSFSLTTRARGKAQDDEVESRDWGLTLRNMTMLAAIEHKRPDTHGVLVTSVNPAGPAGSAKPPLEKGDFIVSVDGKALDDTADFRQISEKCVHGQKTPAVVVVAFDRGVSRMLTAVKLNPREPAPEEDARKPGLPVLLQPIGPELADALKLKATGARVSFVFPGGSAEKAGVRVGDILVRFDEEAVTCEQENDLTLFLASVRRKHVGDRVPCELLRDGRTVKLTLALEAGDPEESELKTFKDKYLDLTLRNLTQRERIVQQLPEALHAVRVEASQSSGWAALAHIMQGDLILAIDGVATPDVDAARGILNAAAENKPRRLVFHVQRGVHTFFAELEPDWGAAGADLGHQDQK